MIIQKLLDSDISRAKKLWNDNFDDGTKGFCDFAFSICGNDNIYIVKEDEKPVSMLMAVARLEYNGKKGFYLYSACTDSRYRGRGFMHSLVKYALEDKAKQGYEFCVTKPATESLFEFYKEMGFKNITKLRKCTIDVKRNLWRTAEFDIVTVSRFPMLRGKFYDGKTLTYAKKDWEKYAEYLYTYGGSTAENEDGYCVYYIENEKIIVKELLCENPLSATRLLQAIREKTGCEQAVVYLPENSNLFFGEGAAENAFAVYGLDDDVYINLMLE